MNAIHGRRIETANRTIDLRLGRPLSIGLTVAVTGAPSEGKAAEAVALPRPRRAGDLHGRAAFREEKNTVADAERLVPETAPPAAEPEGATHATNK